ncbi:MAG: hypothetical protein K2N06_09020 [Oscillospiraceae bacterium]|nr:hypothetical protein [Oscillospiraceae bacterium]
MKKMFSAMLCVALVLVSGCSEPSLDERLSYYDSVAKSEREKSEREESISREAEIKEVDEWGVSLDDVEWLTKEAIRKSEMRSEYRSEYTRLTVRIDSFLRDVKKGKASEYNLEDFLKMHADACKAGIDYIEAHTGDDVKFFYDLYTGNGELDKTEKDLLRTSLTLWYGSIQEIEQSGVDMKSLLEPVISEDRNLTDEEIQRVDDIYQKLVEKVDLATKY